MTFLLFILFASAPMLPASQVSLETLATFSLPEEGEAFLQGPAAVAVDDADNVYLLDVANAAIYVWRKDGTFVREIGKRGEGPGEFSFRLQFGGNAGNMDLFDGKLYVFDGGTRKLHRFSTEGQFLDTLPFKISGGIPSGFKVLSSNRFLVYNKNTASQPPSFEIAVYDRDGSKKQTLYTAEDKTFTRKGSGDNQTVTFQAFRAGPSLAFQNGSILIGDGSASRVERFDQNGKSLGGFSLDLPRAEITEAEREEWWEAHPWVKQAPQYSAAFPDTKPAFALLTGAGEAGLLAYSISPLERRIEGLITDWSGKPKGRFQWALGESGNLFQTGNRLFAVQLDEDDNIVLTEVSIRFQ